MILIVDYGIGNVGSVMNAFKYWNANVEISNDPHKIKLASKIVLPGVGSFLEAMKSLTQSKLIQYLNKAVLEDKKPILGICLGMQLMADSGYEDGWSKGLGWIEGEVVPFTQEECPKLSIPHVGFNVVKSLDENEHSMFGNAKAQDYYFCHSYKLISNDAHVVAARTHYGKEFISAVRKENIWGTQFHPEKSQSNGLMLIKRFLDWSEGDE
jgi:glutamine amidotransferase